MLLDLINKILMVLFFVSTLNMLRHIYYFTQTLFTPPDMEQIKYKLTNKSLLLLGLSIAYALTVLFTGIKL